MVLGVRLLSSCQVCFVAVCIAAMPTTIPWVLASIIVRCRTLAAETTQGNLFTVAGLIGMSASVQSICLHTGRPQAGPASWATAGATTRLVADHLQQPKGTEPCLTMLSLCGCKSCVFELLTITWCASPVD
jgi:hypothetical protein